MYCDIKENALFCICSLSDTVKSVRSVHSPHAVYADQQRLFCVCVCVCVKFDTFAKFNESVHSGPDALSEAVVGRLEDLLEASRRHFWAS